MNMTTITLAAAIAAASACHDGDQSRISEKATCTALVEMVQANNIIVHLVSTRLSEADEAATRWQKWQRKQVSEAEDGTGEFSGAGSEALRYAGAAKALCEAADELHQRIQDLARSIHEPAVHAEEREIRPQCLQVWVIDSPDTQARREHASKWRSELSEIQQAESRYTEGCTATYGTMRPWSYLDGGTSDATKPELGSVR